MSDNLFKYMPPISQKVGNSTQTGALANNRKSWPSMVGPDGSVLTSLVFYLSLSLQDSASQWTLHLSVNCFIYDGIIWFHLSPQNAWLSQRRWGLYLIFTGRNCDMLNNIWHVLWIYDLNISYHKLFSEEKQMYIFWMNKHIKLALLPLKIIYYKEYQIISNMISNIKSNHTFLLMSIIKLETYSNRELFFTALGMNKYKGILLNS